MGFFDSTADSATLDQTAKTVRNFQNGFAVYSAFSNIALQSAVQGANNAAANASATVAQNQRAQQYLNIIGQQQAAEASNGVAGGNTARLYAMRAGIQNAQAQYAINAREAEEKSNYAIQTVKGITGALQSGAGAVGKFATDNPGALDSIGQGLFDYAARAGGGGT